MTEPSKTDEELARVLAERIADYYSKQDCDVPPDMDVENEITQAFTAIRAQAKSEALPALKLVYLLIDQVVQSEEDFCEIETAIRKLKATK